MTDTERGANIVEFAIIAPVLLLLLAFVVDLGRSWNNYIIITNAAREGARYAARLPCYQDDGLQRTTLRNTLIDAVIQEAANSGVVLEPADIEIAPDPVADGCAGAGNPIQVTVYHDFATFLGGITGYHAFRLPSSTRMVSFGNDQL